MKRLFNRLPLPAKLMLIAVVPLALLIYFALEIFNDKNEKINFVEGYLERAEQSASISKVVEALQTERRYSFGQAVNNDWQTEINIQRPKTDEAVENLKANSLTGDRILQYTFLDSLDYTRAKLDQDLIAAQDIMDYYNSTISRLNTLNAISTGSNKFLSEVQGEISGQKLLAEMVTYLGMVRANIYFILYTKTLNQQLFEDIRETMQIFRSYEAEFNVKGSDSARLAYKNQVNEGALHATLKYIDDFLANEALRDMDAEDWWNTSASGVDELMKLQRQQMDVVQKQLHQIYDEEKKLRNRTLIFLLITIVVVIFLVVFTIMAISSSLNALNRAAGKISAGESGLLIKSETDDVIGSLAESFLEIDRNNRKLAIAAEEIGKGNFEIEVSPRSEKDILGNAVVKMKSELQLFHEENEEKIWIHEGLAKINEAITGEKSVKDLLHDTLHAIAEYIDASTGIAYTKNNGSLEFTSGFAIMNDDAVPQKIQVGQSILGLAAEKQELIAMDDVPEDYLKIGTATGSMPPKHIIILPFVQNKRVEAIIELASARPFHSYSHSFLNQLSHPVAVAVHIAKNRSRMQELLEETQAQAEELQSQQSELENINAELEAQAQKLQASEEELKVQQEELMQANQELEERSRLLEEKNQLISERNLEIQKKAEELEISSKYKSEFLANMSHELRTPLNSILLLSRLLAENKPENLNNDQVQYAQVIQSSGSGLLHLIDDILDLSKIEAGKMEVEYQQVPVQAMINDLEALFAPLAKEKHIEFVTRISKEVPSTIETDKLRLEQVLKNLLSNAVKFTGEGSVTLEVTNKPGNNEFISLSVKDTGIGIPKDKQHLVFEAFQQADGSTRRKFGGTGLGLSISKNLVELLGGEIKIESEPGRGSAFTIFIPVRKASEKPTTFSQKNVQTQNEIVPSNQQPSTFRTTVIPQSLPDDREHIEPSSKTILIIEDDVAFAKALVEYTHGRGYKALVAVRGDEGIELARKFKPVGILLDLQLPVKDGWEVMQELKQDPETRSIPVHMMSSHQVKKESLVKGAIDFISKPVAFEQMQEVFRKIEQAIVKEKSKVLIIEENPKHAKALAFFLESYTVKAEISGSIQKGMESLKEKDVDCVILDMGIPDEHAYQLLEQMKQNQELENIPVIVFTGKSFSKSEESRIRKYADTIVIKTANSYQRILDEVSLFLHLVEENKKTVEKKKEGLGAMSEVLSGKKILVTDDDVRNIFSLSRALEAHNIEVVSAIDGKEALKMLEKHPDIDLVLMDIMMPEMDGYEAMEKIRKMPAFRNLPVIAITAKAMSGDREKCIKAGASDYISKPVDIDQLLSLLRVWLYDRMV